MDDREKNYTRKMYEHVLQQQYQQQYFANYNYKPMMATSIPEKVNMSQGLFPQKSQTNGPSMLPIPSQMMRPTHLDPNGGNFLGFQMNPVSKNRKK
jgi:hypothetical protein